MTDEAIGKLREIARSRTEASRVARAQMLVRYAEKPSFYAVGQRLGVHHQTVQRCVERALAYGPLAARATLEQSNRLRVEIVGSLSQSGCPGRCPFDRW
jgi:hypothetical protein